MHVAVSDSDNDSDDDVTSVGYDDKYMLCVVIDNNGGGEVMNVTKAYNSCYWRFNY